MQLGNQNSPTSILGLWTPLTLAQVGEIIHKREAATKKWLEDNNVPVHFFCKTPMVYEFDLRKSLEIIHVKKLQSLKPYTWKEEYKLITSSDGIYEQVVNELEPLEVKNRVVKAEIENDSDNNILNRLINGKVKGTKSN